MNSFDNLYVPDPYSGSILKPQAIWMVDPYTWPNKRFIGGAWIDDKWPFDATPTTAPNIPKVPWSDEERRRKSQYDKDYYDLFEQIKNAQKSRFGFEAPKSPWTNTLDGDVKFTLELAGWSKENIFVEIKDDKQLLVIQKSGKKLTQTFDIPNPERLNLESAQLTMEHGLLAIIFPPKKVEEKKTIKLL